MAKNEMQQKIEENKDEEENLKGTFISVMILGGFIIASWLGVWLLFLSR